MKLFLSLAAFLVMNTCYSQNLKSGCQKFLRMKEQYVRTKQISDQSVTLKYLPGVVFYSAEEKYEKTELKDAYSSNARVFIMDIENSEAITNSQLTELVQRIIIRIGDQEYRPANFFEERFSSNIKQKRIVLEFDIDRHSFLKNDIIFCIAANQIIPEKLELVFEFTKKMLI